MTKKALVRSVEKSLRIIELFKQYEKLNLTEIAGILNLPKSTAFGLIATLEKYGYLEQEIDTGKYQLGITLLEMGSIFSSRFDIMREAMPIMERLSKEYGGNAHITKLIGNEVVYMESVEPTNTVIVRTKIGSRAPANCTSTGKAFLSCFPDEKIEMLFKESALPKLTEHSISDVGTLKEHLAAIRKRGYSIDMQESILGVEGAGTIIKRRNGEPILGISLAGLSTQFDEDLLSEIGITLKEEAEKLSKKLG